MGMCVREDVATAHSLPAGGFFKASDSIRSSRVSSWHLLNVDLMELPLQAEKHQVQSSFFQRHFVVQDIFCLGNGAGQEMVPN